MEKAEPQKEKTRLEELRDVIAGAREGIEEEFKRTANPWLACFAGQVFAAELLLESPKTKALLPAEQYQQALNRLEELKQRLWDLKQQYPERTEIVPEEIKEELLKKLDVLRSE